MTLANGLHFCVRLRCDTIGSVANPNSGAEMPLDSILLTYTDTSTEVLKRARGFIMVGWCKGWFAQDKAGNTTAAEDVSATSWCMIGSVRVAAQQMRASPADEERAIHRLYTAIGVKADGVFSKQHIVCIHNNRAKNIDEITDVFDRAIAAE